MHCDVIFKKIILFFHPMLYVLTLSDHLCKCARHSWVYTAGTPPPLIAIAALLLIEHSKVTILVVPYQLQN